MSIKTIGKLGSLILIISSLLSCKPEFYEAPEPGAASAGTADFSTYVAVGSSITAGFMDDALYTEGQNHAYPNLLATKFQEVAPGLVFTQPDINSDNGWSGQVGKGRLLMTVPACSTIVYERTRQNGESSVPAYAGDKVALDNLAVPFIRIANINTATVSSGTNYNNPGPYYDRLVNSGNTAGIAAEAKARNAKFFTVYLGYVDALRYATSGGTTALPDVAVFQANIEAVLDSLLAVPGSKGVIATIPYVDQFPVVTNNNRRLTSTTDPARTPFRLTQAQADSLNAIRGDTKLNGAAGNRNFFIIHTDNGEIFIDPAKDFIVRSADLEKVGLGYRDANAVRTCTPDLTPRTGLGFSSALSDTAVLDRDEIVYLRSVIDQYNTIIKNAVAARNTSTIRLAVVDLNAFYTTLTNPRIGIVYGSNIIRANHPSLGPDFGGFYSLDRIHPSPRGQVLLANEFLKTINKTWGSSFTLYDPMAYRANPLP